MLCVNLGRLYVLFSPSSLDKGVIGGKEKRERSDLNVNCKTQEYSGTESSLVYDGELSVISQTFYRNCKEVCYG